MEWTTQQGRAESAWQRYGTACMPWLTAAVGLAFTLWLAWMLHSLHSQRVEDRIRHEAIHVAGEFRARMEEQSKALQRMAERWNHDAIRQPLLWLRDARHYLADFPPYHAITLVYADGSVCCSVTAQGAVVGGDLAAVAGVAVGGQGAFFTTAGLDNGEAGLLYVVPLAEGDMLVGIFSIPRLLTFTVDHSVRGGHLLSVAQAHRVIHAPAAVQGLDPSISRPVVCPCPACPGRGVCGRPRRRWRPITATCPSWSAAVVWPCPSCWLCWWRLGCACSGTIARSRPRWRVAVRWRICCGP